MGAHLVCHLLESGKAVKALRRAHSSLNEFEYIFSNHFEGKTEQEKNHLLGEITWVYADIMDVPTLESALDGSTEVYHCAAVVSFLPKDFKRMAVINVEGTANMINISLLKGVKRFCFVSSIAALGRDSSGKMISEKVSWENTHENSHYAISKHKAEMEVWRGMEEGLQVVIVNPAVILGIGDWNKGPGRIFEMCHNQFPLYTEGINGYVDVRDVCKAMVLLMQKENCYGKRFILTGENLSLKDFMYRVCKLLGKRKPYIRVTATIAAIAWRTASILGFLRGKDPLITRETARTSLKVYRYDSSLIRNLTGFTFTSIDETFVYICQVFQQFKQK